MRRLEQKPDPDLKGLRWVLLKDCNKPHPEQRNDLDTLVAVAQFTSKRAARAWLYRAQLRDILDRKRRDSEGRSARQSASKNFVWLVRRRMERLGPGPDEKKRIPDRRRHQGWRTRDRKAGKDARDYRMRAAIHVVWTY
jgi:hypothetical protein